MAQEQTPGLETFLRRTFQPILNKIADFCIAHGITANMVTLAGLVGISLLRFSLERGI